MQCAEVKCKNPSLEGFGVCEGHYLRPTGLMFNLWAMDGTTKEMGAHILIQAAHHVHISDVLELRIPPLPQLQANGEYHRQLVLRQVCEDMTSMIGEHGKEVLKWSDKAIASDLLMYNQNYEDEEIHFMTMIVKEWRDRQSLLSQEGAR